MFVYDPPWPQRMKEAAERAPESLKRIRREQEEQQKRESPNG
ncbi:MAG: hypothetical protein EWM73_00259 [Nitrospira sp.]|nr:MAG: hypothetical protein EWM73_00259 [Nitrospira sp.]